MIASAQDGLSSIARVCRRSVRRVLFVFFAGQRIKERHADGAVQFAQRFNESGVTRLVHAGDIPRDVQELRP